ncbi:MAG: Uma2 family endonuclease [Synechococcales cyanobacterium T60_A2020_003]|nr:Uma2 family endonuclease [Synechococcales cyanobacterium T60_A2020_003]
MTAVTLSLNPTFNLTEEAFYQLCRTNPDLRFELTAQGKLVIMPPMGGEGSKREADLTFAVQLWNRQAKLGVVFSPSAGFTLPNGAIRSPDVAWIVQSRWDALTPEQRRKFPPIAPDFVIELRSDTDDWVVLQAKMREYIENGVRLGWLLNPQDQQVEVYQPGHSVEILQNVQSLSGEPVLPGFTLDLAEIFI